MTKNDTATDLTSPSPSHSNVPSSSSSSSSSSSTISRSNTHHDASTPQQRQQHQVLRIHPSTIPMIGGFMGGIVSTTLLLPLDIIKLRLQVTESTNTDPNRKYRNFRAIRIIGGILKYEGIYGLYQGWTPAVIGSSVSWGGYFFFYEGMKRQLINYRRTAQSSTATHSQSGNDSQDTTVALSSMDNFILACFSGTIMVALTNPIWLVKTRMQLQMKKVQQQQQQQQQLQVNTNNSNNSHARIAIKPYNNMMDAFRTIIRDEGGIMALYKGTGPALLLTSHGGVQFVVYEYLRKHNQNYFMGNENVVVSNSNDACNNVSNSNNTNSNVWLKLKQSAGYLTMGAIAKIAATTTTYPLQLIKARMQQRMDTIDLLDDQSVRIVQRGDSYRTMLSTIQKIYTHEGISGFFKGCLTNAIRVAPGAAITFVVYEEVTDRLKQNIHN